MASNEQIRRIPDDQAEEIYKKLEEPYLPPQGDYELTTPHPARDDVTQALGIEESLVKPLSSPPFSQHWVSRVLDGVWDFATEMGGLSDDEDGEDKDQGKDDKGNESDSDILPGYVPRDIGEERPLFWDGKGKRTLDELKSRNSDGLEGWWRPIRPTPRVAWPGGKIKTEWYENMYTSLYLRTKKFVDDYFGYGQLPRARKIHGIEYSLWLEIPEKLRRYIALVARQDNTLPWGWDDLLMQRVHREYVIQGVIGKIFERYIWDELLFGANERQLELLEKEDRMTVDLGGFRRTANRADTVRMFLGAETETPLFWDKVDELTLKIITLLLPVINLLDDHFVKAREQSLRVIYQELHYLVTQAGLLAIGIRWSHDIFRFEWPIPGLPFDNEQQNVDQWPYDRSVRFARAFDEEAEQPTKEAPNPFLVTGDDDWRFPLDIFPFYGADKVLGYLYSVFVKFWNPLWNRMVRYGMRGLDPLSIKARRDMFLKPTKTHSPHRMAKVQIAVWPTFARHEVVGQLGEHPVAGHLDMDGERITIMMKAPVVYYSGLEGATEDHAERIPTLEEHVLAHRLAIYWEEWGQYIKWFVLLTIGWVILLTTLAAIFPAFGAVVRAFTYFLMGSIKALIRQVTLWSLAVLGNLIRAAVGTRKVFRFLYYALGNTLAELAGHDGPLSPESPRWPVTATPGETGWLPIWWWSSANQSAAAAGEQVRYPRLDLETFKVLGRIIWGEMRWESHDSFLVDYIGKTAADWWA